MNTTKALLVAIALLLAACGGNDQTPPTDAPGPVDTPTTTTPDTTVAPDTTNLDDGTATTAADDDASPADGTGPTSTSEPATPDQPDTTTAGPAPEPAETSEDTTGTETRDLATQATCEAAGGTWDTETATCTSGAEGSGETPATGTQPGDTAAAPGDDDGAGDGSEGETSEPAVLPVRLVIYEGITSEERCLVAGAIWDNERCVATLFDNPEEAADYITYWEPTMMDDAYEAVDPETVEADHRDRHSLGGPWGFYKYHVFYHYNGIDDPQAQYEIMREAASHAVLAVFQYLTDWVWFPHRYDISWTDNAGVLAVVGTYPLGEQRTLLLNADPAQRTGPPNIGLPLPLPPPIRPTMPFAEAQYPHSAGELGRNCPPVEEVWDGYGSEVTDQCTLDAVQTALDYMWPGDAEDRQKGIRDGQAMAEFLHEIDDIEDPFLKANLGYHSRLHGYVYTRDVYWAGHFPGASMIHVEWNPVYADREFTPEEQAAKVRYARNLQERGYDVPADWFGDEQTLGDMSGWGWDKALIARTADGTWRVSYRAVCHWYHSIALEQRLLCPDDPNPHFPDSAFYDIGLHPPSHKFYYQDGRNDGSSPFHQDKVSHRRSGEYVGVPPS